MKAMNEKVKRRLTTVLCADVQGYTRLMEADEAGTLAGLRRSRAAMKALVERHDGRIVNTWGDAVIAEFASVIEAVQCAAEIQQELRDAETHLPEAERMRFRIGINLGDVMVDGSDIYGDGVNIAARLQQLAEPGGILISGPVYEQVRNRLSIGFDFAGARQVKNVETPVMTYRVTLGDTAARPGRTAHEGRGPSGEQGSRDAPVRAGSLQAAVAWFAGLPRSVALVLVISVFLLLINVFTGMNRVWFHWPVTSMALIVAVREILRRR
jgi:adenylate cyclase